MKIIRLHDTAELWIESDVDNHSLHSAVQALIDQGFKPVIYRSGKQDLLSLTQQLLYYASHQPAQATQTKKNRHSRQW